MSKNLAAHLVSKNKRPLEVKAAPYTAPGPKEIVVKNGAVAINPVGRTTYPARFLASYVWDFGRLGKHH
jgi:NADPH:quinone reductase-like Zn-dependent oxidoreductase